jgi:deoxyadenosine/deoxycytidine kinase
MRVQNLSGSSPMHSGLRVAVEGNMGVGKSTLLPRLRDVLPGDWDVLCERADEDPEFKTLLADFYKDPNKQPQFQSWITNRRLREFKQLDGNPQNILFERSFLGEVVFCHANLIRHEKPDGSYISFFYNSLNALKQCRYDAVVYLKASPERCFERMRYRARDAETGVEFEYMRYIHACYEAHLPETARMMNIPLLTIDWDSFGGAEDVRDRMAAILELSKPQESNRKTLF